MYYLLYFLDFCVIESEQGLLELTFLASCGLYFLKNKIKYEYFLKVLVVYAIFFQRGALNEDLIDRVVVNHLEDVGLIKKQGGRRQDVLLALEGNEEFVELHEHILDLHTLK